MTSRPARRLQKPLALARGAVAIGLATALIAKVMAARETDFVLRQRIAETYGVDAAPMTVFLGVVLLDLVILTFTACSTRRFNPALALLGSGGLFLAHHAFSWVTGVDGDCGCFGALGLGTPYSVGLAGSMVLVGMGLTVLSPGNPFDRRTVVAVGLAVSLPLLVAPGLGPTLNDVLEEREDPNDTIVARDKTLFVFSSKCESCLAAARRLKPVIEQGEVVGITTHQHGDVEKFLSLCGARFPVEYVSPGRWFGLLETTPPRFLRIDASGEISPLPTEPR